MNTLRFKWIKFSFYSAPFWFYFFAMFHEKMATNNNFQMNFCFNQFNFNLFIPFFLVLICRTNGFRPLLDSNTPRATPPIFLPPHLASLSSQFHPPLFSHLKGNYEHFTNVNRVQYTMEFPTLLLLFSVTRIFFWSNKLHWIKKKHEFCCDETQVFQ